MNSMYGRIDGATDSSLKIEFQISAAILKIILTLLHSTPAERPTADESLRHKVRLFLHRAQSPISVSICRIYPPTPALDVSLKSTNLLTDPSSTRYPFDVQPFPPCPPLPLGSHTPASWTRVHISPWHVKVRFETTRERIRGKSGARSRGETR